LIVSITAEQRMQFIFQSHHYGYHHAGHYILDRYNGVLQRNEENMQSQIYFEFERDAIVFILGLK